MMPKVVTILLRRRECAWRIIRFTREGEGGEVAADANAHGELLFEAELGDVELAVLREALDTGKGPIRHVHLIAEGVLVVVVADLKGSEDNNEKRKGVDVRTCKVTPMQAGGVSHSSDAFFNLISWAHSFTARDQHFLWRRTLSKKQAK
jgi:hypothetical protein